MALYKCSLMNTFLKCCNFRILFSVHNYACKSSSRNHQNESINIYNEHVLQEKSNKWNEFLFKITQMNKKIKDNEMVNCQTKELFQNCSKEELISKITDCIGDQDLNNVLGIVEICKENLYSIPSGLMSYLLKLFAKLGHKDGVNLMLSYYKAVDEIEYHKKYEFKYYIAQVLWYAGNYDKSLQILEDFYRNNLLIHELNFIIHDIISNTTTKQGEAPLILITNFVKKIAIDYGNYYPMAVLWNNLNGSDWFADQQLADKLLNNNSDLISVVMPIIPLWCVQYMQCHKIDAVHRCCEVLLQYKGLQYYSSVLHDLFDYYYAQQNLKRCSAVVQSALDLNIPLKESYQKRFLVLLTTGKRYKLDDKSNLPKRIDYLINLKF